MTAMEKKKEEKNEHERLKLELRRLKRSNAPWYFESALHQRLHGGPPSRAGLGPYRIPVAVSLSLGVMALLAVGSYFLLVSTGLFSRNPVENQSVRQSADTLRSGREERSAVSVPTRPPAVTGTSAPAGAPAPLRGTPVRFSPPDSAATEGVKGVVADSVRRDTAEVLPVSPPASRDSAKREPVSPPDTSRGKGGTP
jgi:hypothetical protein